MFKEIQEKIERLGDKINAPDNLLPTYGHSVDSAHPHIEVSEQGYHYVVVERGIELERKTTSSLDELLYWVFRDVTFSMAIMYRPERRDPKKDFRRLLFANQIELLSLLNQEWAKKKEQEIEAILKKNPYVDK